MMLIVPASTGEPPAGAGASLGCWRESPGAPSPSTDCARDGPWRCCETVWPLTLCPITMPRRIVAIPGTVTVESMLETVMSSAQACFTGKTRMTIFSVRTAW